MLNVLKSVAIAGTAISLLAAWPALAEGNPVSFLHVSRPEIDLPEGTDLHSEEVYAKAVEPLGLQVTATPQARVSIQEGYNKRPRCCANAFCIPMCPIGAKYDATVHIDMAISAGAELRENAVVFKIDHDAEGRITSLSYRSPDKQDTTLRARQVVVAAHAIETPKLLLMSRSGAMPNGLANSSDQVGRNLMDHPTQLTYGLAPKPVGPYRSPLSTAGIEMLRDGDFRKRRGAFRIELGNDGWSWPGKDPVDWSGVLIKQGLEGRELYRQVMELNSRALRTAALVEQFLAGGGELRLARAAVEQQHVERVLELAHVVGQRRGHLAELARRGGEAAGARDGVHHREGFGREHVAAFGHGGRGRAGRGVHLI